DDQDHADDAARDRRRERRGGLLVTGSGKTLHRTDDLVLPALRRVHGVDAIDQLVDVRCEVVLSAIGLAAHLVQALDRRHHCLRGSSGLARSDRIAAGGVRGPAAPDEGQSAVRARKSSAPPTSSMWPVSTSAVAIAATSAANSSTEYSFPAASRRSSRAPGRARLSRVAVTVASIMSPETTTKETPSSDISARRCVSAVSPARWDRAPCSYSGMVSTSSMKWAWWLVTKTTRPPWERCSSPAVRASFWASRF